MPLGIEPHELLMVSSLPLGTPIERIEVVEESEVAATLQIKFGEGEAQATMVREEGVWRARPPLPGPWSPVLLLHRI